MLSLSASTASGRRGKSIFLLGVAAHLITAARYRKADKFTHTHQRKIFFSLRFYFGVKIFFKYLAAK
jgi:membrane protein DedA with SNARE-associated domain